MAEGLISYKDWQKIDLRVGKILNVEDHPNAEKLYVIEVDIGEFGKRKLVAGLKAHYKKDDLEGKNCIIFLNLEPAVLRGVKSEGMLLAAVNEDESKVVLLSPEKKIELGSKIM